MLKQCFISILERISGVNTKQLTEFISLAANSRSGIYKRIDENRELLEAIQKNAPELLERCPWIEGWIAENDRFFLEFQRISNTFHSNRLKDAFPPYPRPWPGKIATYITENKHE